MELLHPVFTGSALILIAFAVLECYQNDYKNYRAVWFVIVALIFFAGFRLNAGPDYGSYLKMYTFYGATTDYAEILEGASFKTTNIEVEWLFVLLGKIFFDLGLPFQVFTFFIAILAIVPKFIAFEKNSVSPALSWLLYMFPTYFSSDAGQIRQAVSMGIVLLSFEMIKSRRLVPFLLMIYLAMSFHKSSVIFIPAYWLVRVNLNSTRILVVILITMILSPLEIYNYVGFFSSIAPEEVYAGFTDYVALEGRSSGISFPDLICLLNAFFLIAFDKVACQKMPYYEYVRNISVAGICLFFLMRGSPIFSSRLTAIYFIFTAISLPNLVGAISFLPMRKYMYTVLISFVVFYYFVYTSMQAEKANFTTSLYHNFLWN